MSARDRLHAFVIAETDEDAAEYDQRLNAYRAEVLAEAKGAVVTWLAKKAREYRSTGSRQHALQADAVSTMASKIDRGAVGLFLGAPEPADTTPLPVRWDRLVIHPCDPGGETIVCCNRLDDGRPVALQLDDEHREALGLQLLDPDGDDEPAELTVYRAAYEHDPTPLCEYDNPGAARAHCEAHVRRKQPTASLDWIEDDEDDVAELVATVDGEENPTGYLVTALTVPSEYDEEADE